MANSYSHYSNGFKTHRYSGYFPKINTFLIPYLHFAR